MVLIIRLLDIAVRVLLLFRVRTSLRSFGTGLRRRFLSVANFVIYSYFILGYTLPRHEMYKFRIQGAVLCVLYAIRYCSIIYRITCSITCTIVIYT